MLVVAVEKGGRQYCQNSPHTKILWLTLDLFGSQMSRDNPFQIGLAVEWT
jgi:hypothetical protein